MGIFKDKKPSAPQQGVLGINANARFCIATHAGRVRSNNEDNFYASGRYRRLEENILMLPMGYAGKSALLAVFDGMGGEEMGEVASLIAARDCCELDGRLAAADPSQLGDVMDAFASQVNNKICGTLRNSGEKRGGTAFCAVYMRDNAVYPFSLGDCRIYFHRRGELIRVSEDHTLAMRKYKSNIYTLEEAESSSDSHKLTLFLGVDVAGNGLNAAAYQPFTLSNDAKLMLCSDGLYDMVDENEICRILNEDKVNPAAGLAQKALDNGGEDNVTCMVISLMPR